MGRVAALRTAGRGWAGAALGARHAVPAARSAATPTPPATELRSLMELTTIAAALTTDTTIQVPQNAIVARVEVTVMVAIPTAVTFDYGIAGATTRYGTLIPVSATTTYPGTNDGNRLYLAATAIRITPSAQPAAASGRVQVTIWYYAPS